MIWTQSGKGARQSARKILMRNRSDLQDDGFDLTGILTTSPQMIPPASQVGRMLSIYLETPAI
ncbi:MAG TPA: hypothetical protein EYM27_14540 [Dehalococcoidia bacterium]|nr:hypothetical protein [Dehalococcoidia bacterium]